MLVNAQHIKAVPGRKTDVKEANVDWGIAPTRASASQFYPRLLYDYMTVLGIGEHFFSYRYVVKAQLLAQLEAVNYPSPSSAMAWAFSSPVH